MISLALYLHSFLTQKLKNEKQLKEHECMRESLENTMEPRDSSLLYGTQRCVILGPLFMDITYESVLLIMSLILAASTLFQVFVSFCLPSILP